MTGKDEAKFALLNIQGLPYFPLMKHVSKAFPTLKIKGVCPCPNEKCTMLATEPYSIGFTGVKCSDVRPLTEVEYLAFRLLDE